jgi:hypothetical protein
MVDRLGGVTVAVSTFAVFLRLCLGSTISLDRESYMFGTRQEARWPRATTRVRPKVLALRITLAAITSTGSRIQHHGRRVK